MEAERTKRRTGLKGHSGKREGRGEEKSQLQQQQLEGGRRNVRLAPEKKGWRTFKRLGVWGKKRKEVVVVVVVARVANSQP